MNKTAVPGKARVYTILKAAFDQKAVDPVVIDVSAVSFVCDYFIVVSGESEPQVRAIYGNIIRQARKENIPVHHCEDDPSSRWMLVDLYDVVAHIFLREARDFYDIEHLWREGKRIRIPKTISA